KQKPIPFKPFELRDKSGKAIAPNTPVRLPSGKMTTAKAELDGLNKLEKALNAVGHSLRTGGRGKTPVATLAHDKARLKQQAGPTRKSSKKLGAAPKPPLKLTPAQLKQRQAEGKKLMQRFRDAAHAKAFGGTPSAAKARASLTADLKALKDLRTSAAH